MKTLCKIQILEESMIKRWRTVCWPGGLALTYLKIKARQAVETVAKQKFMIPRMGLITNMLKQHWQRTRLFSWLPWFGCLDTTTLLTLLVYFCQVSNPDYYITKSFKFHLSEMCKRGCETEWYYVALGPVMIDVIHCWYRVQWPGGFTL